MRRIFTSKDPKWSLELAALVMDAEPGDEIIVDSWDLCRAVVGQLKGDETITVLVLPDVVEAERTRLASTPVGRMTGKDRRN